MEFKTEEELDIGYQVRAKFFLALGLVGAQKEVYALIRSFTEGADALYYGNYRFISDVTGYSVPSVGRAVRSLISQGLVIKETQAGRYRNNDVYRANIELENNLTAKYLIRQRNRLKVDMRYRSEAYSARADALRTAKAANEKDADDSRREGGNGGIGGFGGKGGLGGNSAPRRDWAWGTKDYKPTAMPPLEMTPQLEAMRREMRAGPVVPEETVNKILFERALERTYGDM